MSYAPNPEALRSAFAAERFSFDETPVQFVLWEAGQLTVSAGRIAAGDPQAESAALPFTQCVPNGEYPVVLTAARFENGEERLAYAWVSINGTPADNWYPALTAGQDARILQPGDFFGIEVESGTACFSAGDSTVGFSTGAGRFACYFGYDSAGRVVALLMDCGVVPAIRIEPAPRRSLWKRLLSLLK